jgi:hypothetical protein
MRMVAPACYGGSCELAHRSAIHVQGDALGHHLHVVFRKARYSTLIAGGHACIACLDACGIGLSLHSITPVEN